MKILLVEPNYKNKFPPLGLMKISAYHKRKKDQVRFIKGIEHKYEDVDRIYITSLFTFEFKSTNETVEFYRNEYPKADIFLGGIAVTILSSGFINSVDKSIKIVEGLLLTSNLIGFNDSVNINELIPDYDILDDVDYVYRESDSYFIHFSRGCIRSCGFCAVSILEPVFETVKSAKEVVRKVQEIYGVKKYMRVMDNNILYVEDFKSVIEQIIDLGYGKNSPWLEKEPKITLLIRQLKRRIQQEQNTDRIISIILSEIQNKYNNSVDSKSDTQKHRDLRELYELIQTENNKFEFIRSHIDVVENMMKRFYPFRRVKPVVDFNQGIDARAIIEDYGLAEDLSRIAIEPCRIAFDSIEDKDTYIQAITTCQDYGINHFSNYMLFNYLDSPTDLYDRLRVNMELSKLPGIKTIFSFPMKYASITETDRTYVGKHWSKLELSGFYAIINVTKGIVTTEYDFFTRAYGKDSEQFTKIILMPSELIKNRVKYEKKGFIGRWNKIFGSLNNEEIEMMKRAYITKDWSFSEKLVEISNFYYVSKHKHIVL